MKYVELDFTPQLERTIRQKEETLEMLLKATMEKYRPQFEQKGMELDAELDRTKDELFEPGYESSLSLAVLDRDGELEELHFISIWACRRVFLGLWVNLPLPGSRITGELLDESEEEIRLELQEFLQEYLEEEDE
ncbi:hypothetical protein AV656_08440 [Bhargavaea cecembensis]|uniref:Uncharacterized protein n=1 Tax=Bhargavaea cecembensis TaxID=394098 RepID=A0A165H6K1_9BACL|nr:hypothetical protein [Bhargavaea cecembensis]KZE38919.1 hypothetical protein AV656_08440 [Bhargavaea cecembensis]